MKEESSKKHTKDFDLWNKQKKVIHETSVQLTFKEREIWWCSLGCNIGSEEDGKNETYERPVVIFRIFNKKILWVLPLTTQSWPQESRIHYTFTTNGTTRAAEIHQLRLISSKRLTNKHTDTVSYEDFQMMRRRLIALA